jgi:zinc transport system permease protein
MAVGVVAIGFLKTNVDLFGLMFGNILTASAGDVWLLAAATAAILVLLAWYFRPLLLSSIDDEGAEANGVDVRRMRLLVLSLVGMAVVVALKVVGILLVSALLVLPGAIARPLTDRWPGFLAGSVGAAVTMLLGGLVLSVSVDIAPGAAIILVGTGLFLGSLVARRIRSVSALVR